MSFELDAQSQILLRSVHPKLREVIEYVYACMYDEFKLAMRVTRGFASKAEQGRLYARGRTAAGPIVTYSPPGRSWHNLGLAVDSCFRGVDPYLEKNADAEKIWNKFGELVRSRGLFWGGEFKFVDKPHAELRIPYLTIDTAIDQADDKGISEVWASVDVAFGRSIGQRYDLIPEWEKLT